MEIFLNSNYRKNLMIMKYILCNNGKTTLEDICILTSSTKRTIQGNIAMIDNGISAFGLQILEDCNKKIHIINTEGDLMYKFNEYILSCYKKSVLFLMIEELFNYGYIQTYKFCVDNYISQATFSRSKKILSDILENKGIRVSNYMIDGLVGDESKIRDFYFKFFDMSFQNIEWPFEYESCAKIIRFYQKNKPKLMVNISEINERRISIILYIMLKRISLNKGEVKNDILIPTLTISNYYDISQFVGSFLMEHNIYKKQVIQKEIQYFIFQLYIEDLVPFDKSPSFTFCKEYDEVSKIINDTINEYRCFFSIDDCTEKEMINNLFKIHLKFKYGWNKELTYNQSVEYILNRADSNFKKIYIRTIEIFERLQKKSNYWDYRMVNYEFVQDDIIIYEYYKLFCSMILKKQVNRKMDITISDTLSNVDQDIIQRQLELIFDGTIIFSKKLERYTDFYITNRGGSAEEHIETLRINSFSEDDQMKHIIKEISLKKYHEALRFMVKKENGIIENRR